MADHEMSENTNDDGFTPQTETALRQGTYNGVMARAAESGVWPDRTPARETPRVGHKPRGASFPEDESRADAYGNNPNPQYVADTLEERDARDAVLAGPGHRAARAALAGIEMSIVHRKARGSIRDELVLMRSRADQRARNK